MAKKQSSKTDSSSKSRNPSSQAENNTANNSTQATDCKDGKKSSSSK